MGFEIKAIADSIRRQLGELGHGRVFEGIEIQCDADNCTISLAGKLPSYYQKQLLIMAVGRGLRRVNGYAHIHSNTDRIVGQVDESQERLPDIDVSRVVVVSLNENHQA